VNLHTVPFVFDRDTTGGELVGRIWVGASTLVLAAVLFLACGGNDARPARESRTSTTAAVVDVAPTAADFPNINTLTPVRSFFVGNLLGDLDETLAVAKAGEGRYPVGSLIQLVPFEAMVKRAPGFDPSTNDWEFFSLDVSDSGTKIAARGSEKVVNRFGGNCASCHQAARAEFDFVCEKDHGCAPLPIGDDLIKALQKADPRPLAEPTAKN
jgi:hypothetical protein